MISFLLHLIMLYAWWVRTSRSAPGKTPVAPVVCVRPAICSVHIPVVVQPRPVATIHGPSYQISIKLSVRSETKSVTVGVYFDLADSVENNDDNNDSGHFYSAVSHSQG